MNRSWYLFYGRQLSMDRQETLCTRFGEMLDLINCLSIYNGGAEQKAEKKKYTFDEAMALR